MKNLFFLIAICFIFSCDELEEEEANVYKTLMPFHTVELNSVFDVFLVQDTAFGMRISAPSSIVSNVTFKIDSGILRIRNESRVKWLSPENNKVKLFIHADRLQEIWPKETCSIKTINAVIADEFLIVMGHKPKLGEIDLDLDCNTFLYWNNHQCGGKVTLRGKTDNLLIYSYGLMSVDAQELNTNFALIENNSKGDCSVRVENRIEYSIRGVGNIYLYGNPVDIIPLDVISSGRLLRTR